MKSLLFISILILALCGGVFAQTNETLPCPTFDVTGPAGIVQPGELVAFTGNLSKEAERFNLEYKWTVSGGEIFEGQGTLSVKVSQKPENAGENLTLTLEVIGLPQGCPNTSSETAPICSCPEVIAIDEFSIAASRIDKARLDYLATESQKNPIAQIYIIERFERKTSQKAIERKNQKTIAYLKTIGIERDFITLLNTFSNENLTRFIIVPAGAVPPSCDDCVIVK